MLSILRWNQKKCYIFTAQCMMITWHNNKVQRKQIKNCRGNRSKALEGVVKVEKWTNSKIIIKRIMKAYNESYAFAR